MKSNKSIINGFINSGKRVKRELDSYSRDAIRISEQALLQLIKDNKDTEFGRAHGFDQINSIEDYKVNVGISSYDEYEPIIKRMYDKGEKNLLTAYKVVHYAQTSGSIGFPKYIPVTDKGKDKFVKYSANLCFAVADEYYRNTTEKELKVGYGINLVDTVSKYNDEGVSSGPISGNIISEAKDISDYIFSVPWQSLNLDEEIDMNYLIARYSIERSDITFIDGAFLTSVVDFMDYIKENRELLCMDIYHGRIDKEVKISDANREKLMKRIRPNPKRAKEVSNEIKKGMDEIIPRIWPNIQFVAGIGTGGFSTYYKRAYQYTGKKVPFNNLVYAASEGVFAAARRMGDTSYVLIPDSGFYEFIPVGSKDDSRTLTIDQLEQGIDYEMIITNLSGLYRYRLNDVVRVTGFYNEAPLIKFVYRKNQVLSLVGENMTIDAVRWCIEQFAVETGLTVIDYSLYGNTDSKPSFYEMFIEVDEVLSAKDLKDCRDILEEKFMQANLVYGNSIRLGRLGPLKLIPLQSQTYQLYRDLQIMKGASRNQLKLVNVIDTPLKYNFFATLKEEIK